MKGNKYYDEEDLYDDDDYYDDDYYEEAKPKAQKTQNNANTQKKQNTNAANSTAKKTTTTSNATTKKADTKTVQAKTASPKKSALNTTESSKTNQADDKLGMISLDSKISVDSGSQIKKEQKEHHKDKGKLTFSAEELNALKYPKVEYNLQEEKEDKPNINIVIIGHVDSGKSTLMGHLLYLQGEISDKTLQKYEKESKKVGKNTFHFAWAMDESTEERKRGVTVDIAYKYFQTEKKKVTAMDAPGHRDFIPNMITGTSAADAAILVIDSNKNAFEAGFFMGGQTKEHAVLARSLGVKQLIVCVNKLELMDWSKERFEYIEAQVRDFLNSLDYQDKDISFLPVSGLKGTNLNSVDKSIDKLGWYEGKTLIEMIDSLDEPTRDLEAPVRFSVADAGQSTINSLQGVGVFGKLETGVIFDNEEYLLQPIGIKAKIRTMSVENSKVSYIKAGQSGEMLLTIDKSMADEVRSGFILCSVDYPIHAVNQFKAQILTLDLKSPLSVGQNIFVHCQSQKSPAKIKKIDKIFSKDGKTSRSNAVVVPKNYNAFVILELEERLCVELYSNIKQLGRITLRASGDTLAVGVVLEFI